MKKECSNSIWKTKWIRTNILDLEMIDFKKCEKSYNELD